MELKRFVQPYFENLVDGNPVDAEVLEKLWGPGVLKPEEMALLEALRSLPREDQESEFIFKYPRERIKDLAGQTLKATMDFLRENRLQLKPSRTNLAGRVQEPGYYGSLFQKSLTDGYVYHEVSRNSTDLTKRFNGYTRVFYLPFNGAEETKKRPRRTDRLIRFVGTSLGFDQLQNFSADSPGISLDTAYEAAYLQLWNPKNPYFALSLRVENYHDAVHYYQFRFSSLSLYCLADSRVYSLMKARDRAIPSIFGS